VGRGHEETSGLGMAKRPRRRHLTRLILKYKEKRST
jgi:hypothetical protein